MSKEYSIFANHKSPIIGHKSKILVTGGTGFLGAYILKALVLQDVPVRAIKRSASQLPSFIDSELLHKVEWVEGDILDVISLEEAMEGVDTVIHSAAIVSFSKKERRHMYQVNVEGTANVVNMALQTGVRRLIHISSVAALGRKKESSTVDETAKWEDSKNNTHYAISKFRAELEAWRGFAEGLEGVVLNPATILGYGNWDEGSCAIFKNVYKEFGWYTNGINGFTDVEDVARAAILLAQNTITEERFVVCNDNWRFRQLLNTMADAFGKKRPGREASPFISGLAWRLEKLKSLFTGAKPLITKESAKVANSATLFDGSKLAKALPGFEYHPLEETIRNACKSYQDLKTS
ncbi:NAD-dependent epimerase/dehydratase family protein [Niabella sp.]|uniref:NAD-dependent epimerase/dehydratase family protein n=1 Tax=Niabella sp. TaxID=1962976 RepID=UPI0026382011|nr:NAD-dependent epimerase/dehydratase family protein [Niabella sp.]